MQAGAAESALAQRLPYNIAPAAKLPLHMPLQHTASQRRPNKAASSSTSESQQHKTKLVQQGHNSEACTNNLASVIGSPRRIDNPTSIALPHAPPR